MSKTNHTIRKVLQHGPSLGITIPPDTGFVLGDYVRVAAKDGKMKVEKVEV